MYSQALHTDRHKLLATFYKDPSLAFAGDSELLARRRLKALAPKIGSYKGYSEGPTQVTNIKKDALRVLDHYPISRGRPKNVLPPFPFAEETNYFAPSASPLGFMRRQTSLISHSESRSPSHSPDGYSRPHNSHQLRSAPAENYTLMHTMTKYVPIPVRGTRGPRSSTHSTMAGHAEGHERALRGEDDQQKHEHDHDLATDANSGSSINCLSAITFRKTQVSDGSSPDKTRHSVIDSHVSIKVHQGQHDQQQRRNLRAEISALQTFTALKEEILSYLSTTGDIYPRSTLETMALKSMIDELDDKRQLFISFLQSKYMGEYNTIFQDYLDSGSMLGQAMQSSCHTPPSVRITTRTSEGMSEISSKMSCYSNRDDCRSLSSPLSLVTKTQNAIKKKLAAIKASFMHKSAGIMESQIDATSSLHESLTVHLVQPWYRGHATTQVGHLSTSLQEDRRAEDSEIGIAPIKIDSSGILDDNGSSRIYSHISSQNIGHLPSNLTLSTSTVATGQLSHKPPNIYTENDEGKRTYDYDSPAVTIAFSKEVEDISQQTFLAHASASTTEGGDQEESTQVDTGVLSEARDAFLKSKEPVFSILEDDIYQDYYVYLERIKESTSPHVISVPANSQMQLDIRNASSPDTTEARTSRSVQRMSTNNLMKTPGSASPQEVVLGNTVGDNERNRGKSKTAPVISTGQPRKAGNYLTVQDYDNPKVQTKDTPVRVPTSSPQKVNLELEIAPPSAPLKFEFLSTIKARTSEATHRTSEVVSAYLRRSLSELSKLQSVVDNRSTAIGQNAVQTVTQNIVHQPMPQGGVVGAVNTVSDNMLINEIQKYITRDINDVYSKFIETLQGELANKLRVIEKDIQAKIKALITQRRNEYETVRLNINESKANVMDRIASLQESIKVTLTAHKAGTKNIERKVQLSLARNGIHDRLPQLNPALLDSLKDAYCTLSKTIGNWIASGYEQCTAITCQSMAGNGIRYVLFPCGDSICSNCRMTNPSVCPICLRNYDFAVQAQDNYAFNGNPAMLPTCTITDACAQLRDLLILTMGVEDVEVLGYDDAEKRFSIKDSTGTWQAYSRKLEAKGIHGKGIKTPAGK